jgi:hypothetical protein
LEKENQRLGAGIDQTVPRQNVRTQNVRRDKTSGDKTAGDITSMGQNIRGDKTSVETKRLLGQNIRQTKRPGGQNVPRDKMSGDKTSLWLVCNMKYGAS